MEPRVSFMYGRWYLVLPQKCGSPGEVSKRADRVAAIDPGVRTCFTYFTNDGEAGELGIGPEKVIDKNFAKRDGIENAMRVETDRKRKSKLRRAWYRHNARAKKLRDDLHWKTIKYLPDHFDGVIIGKLSTKDLMRNRTQNTRTMGWLSHRTFLERLKWKFSTMKRPAKPTSATAARSGRIAISIVRRVPVPSGPVDFLNVKGFRLCSFFSCYNSINGKNKTPSAPCFHNPDEVHFGQSRRSTVFPVIFNVNGHIVNTRLAPQSYSAQT
jgi:hypothetical protein